MKRVFVVLLFALLLFALTDLYAQASKIDNQIKGWWDSFRPIGYTFWGITVALAGYKMYRNQRYGGSDEGDINWAPVKGRLVGLSIFGLADAIVTFFK